MPKFALEKREGTNAPQVGPTFKLSEFLAVVGAVGMSKVNWKNSRKGRRRRLGWDKA